MSDPINKVQQASEQLGALLKHFGSGDHRHPSATHGAGATQKVHGNRPGARTQSTILSSADMMPDGFDDASAEAQMDYFLRAAGRSTPVVQVDDRFWLAPPSAVMLPERGAGENVKVSEAPEPSTNMAEGLADQDRLELPSPADSEEGKRFLEAAAEHRQNNYAGPTTPRFEEMFGDMLRSNHPKRAPKSYGGRLTPAVQQRVVSQAAKTKRKGLPLQKMQAISAFVNVLGNRPSTAAEMAFIGDVVDALSFQLDVPSRRSTSTAEPATTGSETPAEQTADENSDRQGERAEDQRDAQDQRARTRRRRLSRRFPTS